METKTRILLLEDNASDAALIVRELRKAGFNLTPKLARDRVSFHKALAEFVPDIILADYSLPGFDALSALAAARQQFPGIPVVVVSGAIGEETAIEALKAGATDYVLKQRLDRLEFVVRRALQESRDLIERNCAEKKLDEERTNLQKIFDVVNVGLLFIDEHGAVKRINRVVAGWGGRDADEIPAGSQPGDILGCLHALNDPAGCGHTSRCGSCPIRGTFETVLRSGKAAHGVETEAALMVAGKPVRLWLDVSADPLVIDRKRHVVLSISNITERKRAEKVLKRDKETLENLVQDKTRELLAASEEMEKTKRLSDIGTLSATVAHELRNPLAAISLAAFNIRRKAQNPLLDRHVESIEKKVLESNQIISNLLFYSRIKPPNYEDVGVNDLIRECIESLQRRVRSGRKVPVRKNLRSTRDLFIEADSIQIKEVVCNLLNNACDAAGETGGRVEISTVRGETAVGIHVKDNGIGIDKEHMDKIFEPFFTTKARGTGLGLAVCRQIITLHNGTIRIASTPGKGTDAHISLPKKRVLR